VFLPNADVTNVKCFKSLVEHERLFEMLVDLKVATLQTVIYITGGTPTFQSPIILECKLIYVQREFRMMAGPCRVLIAALVYCNFNVK